MGLICVTAGCDQSVEEPSAEEVPLMHVLQAYMEATHELQRPPHSEDELKRFLPEGDRWLSSPRDGKRFVIRWNVSVHDPDLDPANPPLIAYEQQGKNGTRQAVNVMGLTELTDAEFSQLSEP